MLMSSNFKYDIELVWENELSQSKALFAKENPNIYKEDLIDLKWANIDLKIIHQRHVPDSFGPESLIITAKQLSQFFTVLKTMSETVKRIINHIGIIDSSYVSIIVHAAWPFWHYV